MWCISLGLSLLLRTPAPNSMLCRRLCVLAALLPLAAAGQPLTLTPRADADAGLPASIRAFDVTRQGTSLRAVLVRARLAATDWELEAALSDQGSETVASFAADEGVLVAVNGGYFGGNQSYSLVLDQGQVLAPGIGALNRSGTTFYPTRAALGLSASRTPDVAWTYVVDGTTYAYPDPSPNTPEAAQPQPTASFPTGGAPWQVTTAIGGGPSLVRDGRAELTWTEEVFFGGSGVDTTSARARTAVGYTADGDLLIVAVSESNGLTLPALAALLADLGAVEATNLDGGGSTALSAGGVRLVSSARPVVSALRLRQPSASANAFVFDTGDGGYRESAGWFASANAPFYGGTPSRLHATGSGDGRATFTLASLPAGEYDVEAWWVPAPNRATDTPFTVFSSGAGQTVRVDQTDPSSAGRWSALGRFALSPGDSVVVTNEAAGAASPAYVSVDALRLTSAVASAAEDGVEATTGLRVAPNPASGSVTVGLGTAEAEPAWVEVIDMLGRTVRRQPVSPGAASATVDMSSLAGGRYVVRVVTKRSVRTAPVTVVR